MTQSRRQSVAATCKRIGEHWTCSNRPVKLNPESCAAVTVRIVPFGSTTPFRVQKPLRCAACSVFHFVREDRGTVGVAGAEQLRRAESFAGTRANSSARRRHRRECGNHRSRRRTRKRGRTIRIARRGLDLDGATLVGLLEQVGRAGADRVVKLSAELYQENESTSSLWPAFDAAVSVCPSCAVPTIVGVVRVGNNVSRVIMVPATAVKVLPAGSGLSCSDDVILPSAKPARLTVEEAGAPLVMFTVTLCASLTVAEGHRTAVVGIQSRNRERNRRLASRADVSARSPSASARFARRYLGRASPSYHSS